MPGKFLFSIDFFGGKLEYYKASDVYPKCLRCSKYLESVDKDVLFNDICDRCSTVMHTFFYDIHHGVKHMLPPKLVNVSEDVFIKSFVRTELQHLSFEELQHAPN